MSYGNQGVNVRGNDGLDGISRTSGSDDEPEEHVDHIDDPDGEVQVEAVTEEEAPQVHRFDGLEFRRAHDGQRQSGRVEERGADPVESDPVGLGTGDASLAYVEGHDFEEAAADDHADDLDEEQGCEREEDRSRFVPDCILADGQGG